MLWAIASALAFSGDAVQMESGRVSVPAGWEVGDSTPRSTPIELLFMVKQQRVDELESALMRVSTPSSATYGCAAPGTHPSAARAQSHARPLQEAPEQRRGACDGGAAVRPHPRSD